MKRFTHNTDEKRFKLNLPFVVKIGLSLLGVVLLMEIWMINQYATYGTKVEQLYSLRDKLKLENQILENQIAAQTSMESIEKKAKSLGFSEINQVEYLRPQALASR